MPVDILKLGTRDGAVPCVLGRTERRLVAITGPEGDRANICAGRTPPPGVYLALGVITPISLKRLMKAKQ